jgi:hypothetical protein
MLNHIEVGGRVVIVLQDVVISAEITGVRAREHCKPAPADAQPCGCDGPPTVHKETCCDELPPGPAICIETGAPVCVDRNG